MLTAGEIMGHPELIRLGARPPAQFDAPFVVGDSCRLRVATGWKPKHDLESGLRDTADSWRAEVAAEVAAGQ
jgi:nucleoside-diphosphate-sugar epimerase